MDEIIIIANDNHPTLENALDKMINAIECAEELDEYDWFEFVNFISERYGEIFS